MATRIGVSKQSVMAGSLLAVALAGCGALGRPSPANPEATPTASAGAPRNEAAAQPRPAEPVSRSTGEGVPPQAAKPPLVDGPKLFPGTGQFLNSSAVPTVDGAGPPEVSLNFEALDIREAAKVVIGDYLRESYTVHPAVSGNVTLRTVRPVARSALLPMLEMLLRQNNAVVVREDGLYKIVPAAGVRGSVAPQRLGAAGGPLAGYTVLVVPLRFISAKEMAKILEPFAPDNTVRADELRNMVVLSGNQKELRHLVDTIDLFDVDWLSGYSVGVFPIKSAEVKTLVADLDKVFGPTGSGPLAGIVRLVPIERLNAIVVVTTQPKYLEAARTWVDRLDQIGTTSAGTRLFVYSVQNGKAENLAFLVSELFSKRTATTPPAPTLAPGARPAQIASPVPASAARPGAAPGGTMPGVGATTSTAPAVSASGQAAAVVIGGGAAGATGEVRVIADKDNNALLILASASDYEIIEAAIKKLDVIPKQVLVEVTVAEVTLTDDLRFGVDWFLTGRSVGQSSVTSGQLNMGSLPATPTGAVPAFTGLQLVNRLGGDVRGVLNALGKDGRLQVLATPQLMVLDNQKAQIKIGDRISVQTQQQTVAGTTSGLINSFQYVETGILLSVTPRINSGGQVTLEVNQEVSVPLPPAVAGANPDISQRTASTSVVVSSGESVVLGGLIRQDNTRSTSGIPLLSKIPVLGAAFGTQSIVKRRTETILLIRPLVLTNPQQAIEAAAELRRRMGALESLFAPSLGGAPAR